MSRRVKIQVREVGEKFGCCAVIRDAKSRHRLAETRVFPFGFGHNAYDAAMFEAQKRGWFVVHPDDRWDDA